MATNRHIKNLGRLVGNNMNHKYSYILSESDLTNAYLKMRNDLGYPLQLESTYRRAIVYNKQGLEKQIQNMINECIERTARNLSDLVVSDIVNQLNGITSVANSNIRSGGNRSLSMASILGSALGKGLVDGFFNILDEITDNENYYRSK